MEKEMDQSNKFFLERLAHEKKESGDIKSPTVENPKFLTEIEEAKIKISKILDSIDNKTNLHEYQFLCKATAKKFNTPVEEILTWGLGITGEAGDVASCIKKTFMHDNDKRQGIRENIGDMLWYTAMICNFFDWNLQEVLDENVKKLKERYPKGFTIENARRQGEMIDWNK